MKYLIRFILVLIGIIISNLLSAQTHSFLVGTDFPVQYTVGYQIKPDKFGLIMQYGILTKPYDSVILDVIEGLGANEKIVDIIRNSYRDGRIISLKPLYQRRKWYGGIIFQYFNLKADAIPLDIIQDYYNIDLVSFWSGIPIIGSPLNYGDDLTKIELESKLFQTGLFLGREISFKSSSFKIRTEFSISKNFASSNKFSSKTSYPQSLYDNMNDDISESYRKFAYVPSINIYLLYYFTNIEL